MPGSIGLRTPSASSPITAYATALPSAPVMQAPATRESRSQATGQNWLPSERRAISWRTRVGALSTRRAEKGPASSPPPARPLDSTTSSSPVRSADHTTAAPRSAVRTVVSGVCWSGAVTSNTRSSCVTPFSATQYATR